MGNRRQYIMADKVAIAKRILENISNVRDIINEVKQIKSYLIELSLGGKITEMEFYRISSLLSSQSRSTLWEKYYMEKHSATKISADNNAGDFKLNDRNYEYKVSFNTDKLLHIVQIRLWQGCDYIVQAITMDKIYTFQLLHNQMEHELELVGATPAHGTASANKDNKNVELRATIKMGSADWLRWVNNYLVE